MARETMDAYILVKKVIVIATDRGIEGLSFDNPDVAMV